MVVYLLAMRLPKRAFVGTGAWYYFLLNLVKVPFSVNLGLITGATLFLNALALPAIALGRGCWEWWPWNAFPNAASPAPCRRWRRSPP